LREVVQRDLPVRGKKKTLVEERSGKNKTKREQLYFCSHQKDVGLTVHFEIVLFPPPSLFIF